MKKRKDRIIKQDNLITFTMSVFTIEKVIINNLMLIVFCKIL